MSFNVRYGTADDGPNSWKHRRELVRETIRQVRPDLLCVQEALDFQIKYIDEQLAELEVVGAGREDGRRQGEFVGVFFRRERFVLVNNGHFWLSETPDVPGSKSWGASQTRMVTWACLQDRSAAGGALVAFNTHFDQRSEWSRRESARLLRRRIAAIGGPTAVLAAGDFNATEDDVPYRLLLEGDGERPALIDAYRSVHPECRVDELTRHGFEAKTRGSRIDWMLHSPHFQATQARIVRKSFAGRYPSDHFPVTAKLIRSSTGD